jgi:hypothetical protein
MTSCGRLKSKSFQNHGVERQQHELGGNSSYPPFYVQLIYQPLAEDRHGNDNSGYEALRRQSYARQVLEGAGKEIKGYKGPPEKFRSVILTPILQRYLKGVPDCYAPSLHAAVAKGDEPTISDATEFYLGVDPVSHIYIPQYRRNLLYIAESRWYLGVLLKNFDVDNKDGFNTTRTNHDKAMKAVVDEPAEDDDDDGNQHPFNKTEIGSF